MTAELGHFAMILALMFALAQSVVPMLGAWRRNLTLMRFAEEAALAQLGFVTLAFGLLLYAFGQSDFSVLVVANHSNSTMPLPYRLSAAWGNHEGSLVLWTLILAIFGGAVALRGQGLPASLKARTLAIQGMIAASFLGFSLFTSNPFERLHPAPDNGMELNPLLQDIGLILHPPFLYLGYVGFSIVFSFALAALIEGRVDAAWARFVRPWVLLAWIFLTIGITLGSYWAYYELGWGGWWFWDPVENASFMPWLVGTALLHSALVVERRQTLVLWTILLAILTFTLSLIGTFVVRSGIITSVHAFASDPARGVGILAILAVFTGGALTLFSWRARNITQSVSFRPFSREGALIYNNVLLVVATATVFLGTFYPLFVEMVGPEKISVGPPYFNRSFGPVMVILILGLTVGPFLRWKRDDLRDALRRLRGPLLVTALAAGACLGLFGARGGGAALGLGLAVWLVAGAFWIVVARMQLGRLPLLRSLKLAMTAPPATWGMVLAHAGLGLLVAGITSVTLWQQEVVAALAPGDSIRAGGYDFTLQGVATGQRDNYQSERATIGVALGGKPVATMLAERRFYPVSERVTTEAAISPQGLTNLYASVTGPSGAGKWGLRVHYHPMILLIWLGPALMALGGIVSLADRRMRLGAPVARPAVQGARA